MSYIILFMNIISPEGTYPNRTPPQWGISSDEWATNREALSTKNYEVNFYYKIHYKFLKQKSKSSPVYCSVLLSPAHICFGAMGESEWTE